MGDLDVVAFLDESRKPIRDPQSGRPVPSEQHYAVAAAMVFRGDVRSLRANVRAVALDLGRSLHYADLSPERRTRARLLRVAFPDLLDRYEARAITLETRASPQRGFSQLDQHDHATWQSLVDQRLLSEGSVLNHGNKSEPLLWVADLMAGARTDHLCSVNRVNYALISHRVTAITAVAG